MSNHADSHLSRRVQYAALPYRQRQDGDIQVRLVTSRETRRWVIPKGWPMKGLAPHKAAMREAYEEAGLIGSISRQALGLYTYEKRLSPKRSVTCDVMVFPMKVKRYLKKWPERSQRIGFWFTIESAAAAVQEEELRVLILKFGEIMAERFAEKQSAKDKTTFAPSDAARAAPSRPSAILPAAGMDDAAGGELIAGEAEAKAGDAPKRVAKKAAAKKAVPKKAVPKKAAAKKIGKQAGDFADHGPSPAAEDEPAGEPIGDAGLDGAPHAAKAGRARRSKADIGSAKTQRGGGVSPTGSADLPAEPQIARASKTPALKTAKAKPKASRAKSAKAKAEEGPGRKAKDKAGAKEKGAPKAKGGATLSPPVT